MRQAGTDADAADVVSVGDSMASEASRGSVTGRAMVVGCGVFLAFVAGALLPATQIFVARDSTAIRGTTVTKHIRFAERVDEGMFVPNGMLYRLVNWGHGLGLPRDVALMLLLGACTAVVWYATYRFAGARLGGRYSNVHAGAIAGVTMVVNAIYLPGFNRGVYLGQWGPNVYHNPTHTLVLALAVPLFIALGVLLCRPGGTKQFWMAGALSIALAISVYAKPTFMIVIAPATVVYAAVRMGVTMRTALVLVAALALPTIYLLYVRHLTTAVEVSRFQGRTNQIAPFMVWRHWSDNVALSIAVTFAFPAALVAIARQERRFGTHFLYAWLMCLVAFLLAALLVEVAPSGHHLKSANWFGGYLLANHMLFMVAIVEFFDWRAHLGREGRRKWGYRLCTVLLALHMVSGVVYLVRMQTTRGAAA